MTADEDRHTYANPSSSRKITMSRCGMATQPKALDDAFGQQAGGEGGAVHAFFLSRGANAQHGSRPFSWKAPVQVHSSGGAAPAPIGITAALTTMSNVPPGTGSSPCSRSTSTA